MPSTVSGAKSAVPGPSPHPPGSKSTAATWLWRALPVLAFLIYTLAQPGLVRGDGAGVYTTAAGLVERGSFAIDGFSAALAPRAPEADAPPAAYPRVAYVAGHYYHLAPPGRAILGAPFYALGLILAPLLGPEAPTFCLLLLGALLGAAIVARCCRRWGNVDSSPAISAWLGVATLMALLLPWVGSVSVPLVAAALVAWAVSPARDLWRGRGGRRAALGVGLLLGAIGLIDYALGSLAGILLLALAVRVGCRQRRGTLGVLLLAGGGLAVAVLLAWQTVTFGVPWRLGFRAALDPTARTPLSLLRPELLAALALAGVIAGSILSGAAIFARPGRWGWPLRGGIGLAALVCLALGLRDRVAGAGQTILTVRWWAVAPLLMVGLAALLLAAILSLSLTSARHPRSRILPTALLIGLLLGPSLPLLPDRAVAAEPTGDGTAGYVAPFAIETNGDLRPLWTFERGGGRATLGSLGLETGAVAVSPWIDVWPGAAYALSLRGDQPFRVVFAWETTAREPIVAQAATVAPGGEQIIRFAAPPGAAGLRLRLEATDRAATVAGLRLDLAAGVRVEPLPDGRRAALAFSFDWESAMGGLIHSRSSGEGEGATVGLRDDGGPSVAQAEEKGRRMREGARFLADLFARYEIKATFYSTGYNLLDGNPTCQKFLGDPVYPNANTQNGWGSDWWRTRPWFGDDPCATEAQAPAWYFGSETRALAVEGHEIASHSFGHLYVRGVKPEQLAADLDQWNRAATALGLPPARSFAFPWTSSNSLDDRFWAVFERAGMTVLTRLYQTGTQPLPHPYELDRITGQPNLIVFPDFYLASRAEAQGEALARIDVILAVRGYHSLWNHPNEALEQGGPVIWSRVVEYAAAGRERGLWIAPVTEIATYGTASRRVAVTALPVAGGTRVVVENRLDRALDGLTLHLPQSAGASGQAIVPALGAGATATIVVRR